MIPPAVDLQRRNSGCDWALEKVRAAEARVQELRAPLRDTEVVGAIDAVLAGAWRIAQSVRGRVQARGFFQTGHFFLEVDEFGHVTVDGPETIWRPGRVFNELVRAAFIDPIGPDAWGLFASYQIGETWASLIPDRFRQALRALQFETSRHAGRCLLAAVPPPLYELLADCAGSWTIHDSASWITCPEGNPSRRLGFCIRYPALAGDSGTHRVCGRDQAAIDTEIDQVDGASPLAWLRTSPASIDRLPDTFLRMSTDSASDVLERLPPSALPNAQQTDAWELLGLFGGWLLKSLAAYPDQVSVSKDGQYFIVIDRPYALDSDADRNAFYQVCRDIGRFQSELSQMVFGNRLGGDGLKVNSEHPAASKVEAFESLPLCEQHQVAIKIMRLLEPPPRPPSPRLFPTQEEGGRPLYLAGLRLEQAIDVETLRSKGLWVSGEPTEDGRIYADWLVEDLETGQSACCRSRLIDGKLKFVRHSFPIGFGHIPRIANACRRIDTLAIDPQRAKAFSVHAAAEEARWLQWRRDRTEAFRSLLE